MDAFFASVEQLDHPELRGKPVLVGGRGKRGVVAAASYEAREFGCRSAQPTALALRLCPHAIVVKGSYARYKEISARVFSIFEDFTPLVQPVSIDEAFLDVTGSVALLGSPVSMAERIRERVKAETGLTCSVGVAPNKFLAKLASDLDKPDGLTVIEAGRVHERLDPLPVSRLWGVGPRAVESLARLGVRTIGELRAVPIETLVGRFGETFAPHLFRLARGEDDRQVVTDRHAKSIGHEQTFGDNLTDPEDVRAVLIGHAEHVGHRLRTKKRLATGVTVKIRFGDFETITRSAKLETATDRTDDLLRAGLSLFDAWAAKGFRSVRLIGLTATGLSSVGDDAVSQGGLFDQDERERAGAVDRAVDAIMDKYGTGAIGRARANRRSETPPDQRFEQ